MVTTTFRVEYMDCAAEEQLVRLKLAHHDAVKHLAFDLTARTVAVTHIGDVTPITELLVSLKLGAQAIDQRAVSTAPAPESAHDQRRILWIVLIINLTLFFVEGIVGLLVHSMGLVADSLDMLADALVYGMSLYAVGQVVTQQYRIARMSGYFQDALALFGVVEVIRRTLSGGDTPGFGLMIGMSLVSLLGNGLALIIMQRSRSEGVHIKASLIFTSNDVLVNIGVIVALCATIQ